MKTTYFKNKWVIPLLGCALGVGGFLAGNAYLEVDRTTQSEQAFRLMLERLQTDHKLTSALRKLHSGDVNAAVQQLDLLLCEDVLQVQAELESADGRRTAYAQHALARIAQQRPRNSTMAAGAETELNNDQAAAERILSEASAREAAADSVLAAAP